VFKNSNDLRASAPPREPFFLFTRRRGDAEGLLLAAIMACPVPATAQINEAEAYEDCSPPCPQGEECLLIGRRCKSSIIVTASGARQQPATVGRAITVITDDDLDRLQPSTIADLLATTPGVTVSNTGPIGGFSAVRIRGAEGEQTLALIDGVRLNDPSSPGGGFDFGNLLVGNIERVEVLRGPNSVLGGARR
jgi:vitamin B12 transporter